MQSHTHLTARQLAELLNVSKRTLETLIADGQAPAHYLIGRTRRWDPVVVQAWVAERTAARTEKLLGADIGGK
ncbi:helix-turn-helix transcriptional regulator [Chitinimonas prasina]